MKNLTQEIRKSQFVQTFTRRNLYALEGASHLCLHSHHAWHIPDVPTVTHLSILIVKTCRILNSLQYFLLMITLWRYIVKAVMIGCLRAGEPMYLFNFIQNEWEFKLLIHSSFFIWNDKAVSSKQQIKWRSEMAVSFHIRKANLKIHTYSQMINMFWRSLTFYDLSCCTSMDWQAKEQ